VLKLAWPEATSGVGQFERPQEVACLLEVRTDSEDLVNQVLDADDAVFAKVLLDQGIVRQRDTLLVDLAISTLVDQLADGLQVGVAVGNEGLDNAEHLDGSLGKANEDTIVDLEKTEELESLALLGVDLVDTLDTDHKSKLGLGGDGE